MRPSTRSVVRRRRCWWWFCIVMLDIMQAWHLVFRWPFCDRLITLMITILMMMIICTMYFLLIRIRQSLRMSSTANSRATRTSSSSEFWRGRPPRTAAGRRAGTKTRPPWASSWSSTRTTRTRCPCFASKSTGAVSKGPLWTTRTSEWVARDNWMLFDNIYNNYCFKNILPTTILTIIYL